MRYIDADKLQEEFKELHGGKRSLLIDTEPTADVRENVRGEWIRQDDGWYGDYYECSVCKEPFTLIDGTPQDNLYNFCPNCGAYMRGEQDDER